MITNGGCRTKRGVGCSGFRYADLVTSCRDSEHGDHLPFLGDADLGGQGSNGALAFGKSSHELGQTSGNSSCPDIWELDNGDIAVIGSDLTTPDEGRLPEGVSVDPGERLVIIPRKTTSRADRDCDCRLRAGTVGSTGPLMHREPWDAIRQGFHGSDGGARSPWAATGRSSAVALS